MQYIIKRVDYTSDSDYLKLVAQVGGVFNSIEWLSIYSDNLEVLGLYSNGELIAVWNHWMNKRGPIAFYRTPPLMPGNGFAMMKRSHNASKILSETKEVMEQIAMFYASKKWSVISLNFPPEVIDLQHFVWQGYKVVPAYTYQMSLQMSEAHIMERMNVKVRNAINRAEADGLHCRLEKDVQVVHKVILNTYQRKNAHVYSKIMDQLFERYTLTSNTYAMVCYDGDIPIAASLCLLDASKVYYLLSGYDHHSKHRGAGALCLYRSILHAKESGKIIFDFEGSMLPEVESFFRGFGADLIPYYSVNKSNLILEIIMKTRLRSKF